METKFIKFTNEMTMENIISTLNENFAIQAEILVNINNTMSEVLKETSNTNNFLR